MESNTHTHNEKALYIHTSTDLVRVINFSQVRAVQLHPKTVQTHPPLSATHTLHI